MHRRWVEATFLAGLIATVTGAASAQQRQLVPAQPSIINEDEDTILETAPPQPARPAHGRGQPATPTFEHDPDLDADDQLAPSQIKQPIPAAVSEPGGGRHVRAATHGTDIMRDPRARRSRSATPDIVACAGVFARESSHAKLAIAFQSRNVSFSRVDAGSGGKTMASIIFAKNPKRRLEVWWSKPATRSDIHLIVINGQSNWAAPGDLRLGLALADVERLNGKPFKLSGFDKNSLAALTDWSGGGIAAPAGGCKVGFSMRVGLTASASALSALPADREFTSNDPALRMVNPTISEILVAY